MLQKLLPLSGSYTPGIPNGSLQLYRKRGLVRVIRQKLKNRYSSPLFLYKVIHYKLKETVGININEPSN
jgi:hypothetical protein